MKNVIKMLKIITLALVMVFSITACGEVGDSTIPSGTDTGNNPVTPPDVDIDDDPGQSTGNQISPVERFQANSYTGNDRIKYSFTYNNLDFYYIYLGELKNIPLFFDDVHRHGAIASEYTFSTSNITQTIVSQIVSTGSAEAINIIKENTKSETTGNTVGGEIGAKLAITKIFDLGGKGYYEYNWGDTTSETIRNETSKTTSLTNTIEHGTSHTLETMKSRTFHLTKEDKTGYYRFTYFSVSDVYLYVIRDSNTGDLYYEFREHIIPGVFFWDIDYSETPSFRKDDATGFELDISILENLPKPSVNFVPGPNLAAKLSWLQTNAQSNVDYIVEVNADESITPHTLSYNGRNNITITLRGVDANRTISLSSNGSMFTVESGVTLILDNNITLQDRYDLLIDVYGTLVMNSGSLIIGDVQNESHIDDEDRGITATIPSPGGMGGTAGTIIVDGDITVGLPSSGGMGGTAGTIIVDGRGGVSVNNGGIFTMNGGTISGNAAPYGGGVYVNGGTFTMEGGEITGNTAYEQGGGVYVGNGTFTKTGGTIIGYASDTVNSNVVKNNSGAVLYNRGHAVYVNGSPVKRRETTAGPSVNLDSSIAGSAGGWEN